MLVAPELLTCLYILNILKIFSVDNKETEYANATGY